MTWQLEVCTVLGEDLSSVLCTDAEQLTLPVTPASGFLVLSSGLLSTQTHSHMNT